MVEKTDDKDKNRKRIHEVLVVVGVIIAISFIVVAVIYYKNPNTEVIGVFLLISLAVVAVLNRNIQFLLSFFKIRRNNIIVEKNRKGGS